MNAASSVLGSVLAIIIAIQFGFSVTLATGAGAYLVALLLTTTLRLAQRVPSALPPSPTTRTFLAM